MPRSHPATKRIFKGSSTTSAPRSSRKLHRYPGKPAIIMTTELFYCSSTLLKPVRSYKKMDIRLLQSKRSWAKLLSGSARSILLGKVWMQTKSTLKDYLQNSSMKNSLPPNRLNSLLQETSRPSWKILFCNMLMLPNTIGNTLRNSSNRPLANMQFRPKWVSSLTPTTPTKMP